MRNGNHSRILFALILTKTAWLMPDKLLGEDSFNGSYFPVKTYSPLPSQVLSQFLQFYHHTKESHGNWCHGSH